VTACPFYNAIDAALDIHYVDEDGKQIALEQAQRLADKCAKGAGHKTVCERLLLAVLLRAFGDGVSGIVGF
jgi:hypothetical protein